MMAIGGGHVQSPPIQKRTPYVSLRCNANPQNALESVVCALPAPPREPSTTGKILTKAIRARVNQAAHAHGQRQEAIYRAAVLAKLRAMPDLGPGNAMLDAALAEIEAQQGGTK
jgi:hypothetical protein